MTDYENTFVGWNEVSTLPISDQSQLTAITPEPFPENHALVSIEKLEERPMLSRSTAHKDMLEGRKAAKMEAEEAEAEDDEEEEEEEDEDGEEGEEGEEGDEAASEADYGEEYGEEEEAAPWGEKQRMAAAPLESKFFVHGEKLRQNYNERELSSFMKLLNVKPHRGWEDDSLYHYKLGAKKYEDNSQYHDIHFHILAEVERQYADKVNVKDFRKGAEIKF
jgi:cobalamin biosynthesis protein CobT